MCKYQNCNRKLYTSDYCRVHAYDHVNKENFQNDRILNFCSMENCNRIAYSSKQLCKMHYQQQPEILELKNKWQKRNIEKRKDNLKRYHASEKHKTVHQQYRETLQGRYNTLIRGAAARGIEVHISKEEYETILNSVNKKCYYCPTSIGPGSGLDRIDNSLGYNVDNVVVCCNDCNRLRQDRLTPEETKQVVKLLQQIRGKENIWE